MLEILYQDDHFVAINKPHGLLVHRSSIARDVEEYAVQRLRDQIGQRVNPVHRLDRKTAGVLLFSLCEESTHRGQEALQAPTASKIYMAIVRGHFPDIVRVDHPITNDRGKIQAATTHFRCLHRSEINVPLGKWPTSRYSLIEARPLTGRQHQIRKHLNHLRHPIIGDRPYGCNKQNRLFKQKWSMSTMLLCATKLEITHPFTNIPLLIQTPPSRVFCDIQSLLHL